MSNLSKGRRTVRAVACAAAAALAATASGTAAADQRKFTYSYEAKTLPEGSLEFEQWTTLRTRKESGHFNRFQFREELEIGVRDHLTTALYLNWEYEAVRGISGAENEHEVEFESVSNEWKVKLSDPSIDPVGILLYGEIGAGADEQELEAKLILNKHIGNFNLAYNVIMEFEREEEEEPNGEKEWEKETGLSHTFGVSYQTGPNVSLGWEGVIHQDFEENWGFRDQEHTAFFAGPNVGVATGRWWSTITVLRQLDLRGSGHDLVLDDHEKFEVRLIVGVNF